MAMKCTRCGTLLVPGSVSCPGCGLQFATPVPQDRTVPPVQPQYGAPPQYGTSPQPGPAPQYGMPPPQYGTPPPYGAPQPYGSPPPYGQASRKGVPVWAWIVGVIVLLGVVGELSNIGKSVHNPPTPVPAPTPGPTPAPIPTPTPTPSPTPTPPTGNGDVNALAANMTKFGEALQTFGVINGKPQFDDPVWQKKMEQNIQEIKDDIAAEKQISWPAKFLPAKTNYEGGLAEYEYLADHWVAAVEHTDTAALKDCENHAQHGNDLLTAAEKQIKEISSSS